MKGSLIEAEASFDDEGGVEVEREGDKGVEEGKKESEDEAGEGFG